MPPARALFYAASVAVLVLTGRSLLVEPLPLPWAISALAAYLAFMIAGAMVLRWRVFCDAVVRGPKNARGVALTFDDGPHAVHTRKVLDLLDRANAKAAFFVIASKAEALPDLVREIKERGHVVGLHSYAHDRLFALRLPVRVRKDLARGIRVLEKITGERPLLFRPPVGHTNPAMARIVRDLDLEIVGWSLRAYDGVDSDVDRVLGRVRERLTDGAILLLHDAYEGSDAEPAGVAALAQILDEARTSGIPFVRVDEWV